jgi:F-type H+-transporting ATPase subunit delta
MRTSKQAQREAKGLFRACQVKGVLDDQRAREAVRRLVTDKPRGWMPVLQYLQRLVELDTARRTALVESAVPLTDDQQAGVRDQLSRVYGPALSFTFTTQPALVGGMRVRVGSDVYDGTVQGRLDQLAQSF